MLFKIGDTITDKISYFMNPDFHCIKMPKKEELHYYENSFNTDIYGKNANVIKSKNEKN